MIRIKVPATSANFCIGFDTCGIAFNLYNEYSFEEADYDLLTGFDTKFMNEFNLVLKSYHKFFEYFNIDYIPASISLLKEEIPVSRGLGSSAACIVAGVLGANKLSEANKSERELLYLMTLIEGHPDNVAPAFLGGFIAAIKNDNEIDYVKYNVSKKLKFNVFIPQYTLSTEEARKVLPKKYDRVDVVSNLSRIINLPYALKVGDLNLLKKLLIDKIHEPYRFPLIENAETLKKEVLDKDAILIISGSGSTLLSISYKNLKIDNPNFKCKNVCVNTKGVEYID